MSLAYQAEQLADLRAEAHALVLKHWEEIAHYRDIPLEVDEAFYLAAERSGATRCFTARIAETRELVGYVVFFVKLNPHYANSLQALQDALFLHPEHRRGRAGTALITLAEAHLKAEGVQVVYHHVKRGSQAGELLKRLGYELVDEVYAKRLDERRQ